MPGHLDGVDRRQRHPQRGLDQLVAGLHRRGEVGAQPLLEGAHNRATLAHTYPAAVNSWARAATRSRRRRSGHGRLRGRHRAPALDAARGDPPGPAARHARRCKVLHLSDLHMTPGQRSKQRWVAALAELEPDLVVDTGDNLAHTRAVPGVLAALDPLLSRPGLFVWGSNDYFGPTLQEPRPLPRPRLAEARPRRGAAVARPAGGADRARLAGRHAHPLHARRRRRDDRGRGRRRPAHQARPLRPDRRAARRRRHPQARPDPLPRAPRPRRLRRRRLRPRPRRPHPRRPAPPARATARSSPTAASTAPAPAAPPAGAATCACTSPPAWAPPRSPPPASAARPRPAC